MESPGVAFIGLGAMGSRMAARLLDAGVALMLWNRTASKSHVVAEGRPARVARTPAEAAESVVFAMLPDLAEVIAVMEGESGLLQGWRDKQIHRPVLVVMATVAPEGLLAYQRDLLEHGVVLVDAPVSGGTDGAEAGSLSIMVGGDIPEGHLLRDLLEVLGTPFYLGGLGSGQLAKAGNQLIVAGTLAAVSEAVLLARKGGLDVAHTMAAWSGGLAGSEVLRQKSDRWLSEEYVPGGESRYLLKDLVIGASAAAGLSLALPIASDIEDLYRSLVEAGEGELDHTAIYREIERAAARGAAHRPRALVLMGVSGSGKSSLGRALAAQIDAKFIEGDDLHSAASKEKMSAAIPLTDEDRIPWLRLVGSAMSEASDEGAVVVACSALRREYRDLLRSYVPHACFVHLNASSELLVQRTRSRVHEYMPHELLQSQLDTLEPLQPDELGWSVNAEQHTSIVLTKVLHMIGRKAHELQSAI